MTWIYSFEWHRQCYEWKFYNCNVYIYIYVTIDFMNEVWAFVISQPIRIIDCVSLTAYNMECNNLIILCNQIAERVSISAAFCTVFSCKTIQRHGSKNTYWKPRKTCNVSGVCVCVSDTSFLALWGGVRIQVHSDQKQEVKWTTRYSLWHIEQIDSNSCFTELDAGPWSVSTMRLDCSPIILHVSILATLILTLEADSKFCYPTSLTLNLRRS